MLSPEKLREIVQTLLADDVKDLSDDQSPSFHLQADATVPVGPTAVKVELILGVDGDEIKSECRTKLVESLADLEPAATDERDRRAQEKRAACSGGSSRAKRRRRVLMAQENTGGGTGA